MPRRCLPGGSLDGDFARWRGAESGLGVGDAGEFPVRGHDTSSGYPLLACKWIVRYRTKDLGPGLWAGCGQLAKSPLTLIHRDSEIDGKLSFVALSPDGPSTQLVTAPPPRAVLPVV